MCCMRLAENTERKKSPKIRHLGTIAQLSRSSGCTSQLRHVGPIDNRKKWLNCNISSMSHNMVNFGPLAAEIGLPNCGFSANFNGFRLLASLLHRRRSPEANQTLHDVWPSPGLVHCIYIFRGSCPLREFCQVQNSLCVEVLPCLYWHSSSGREPNFATWYKERN